MENCDICANDVFRDSWKQRGIERRAFDAAAADAAEAGCEARGRRQRPIDQEALVQDDHRSRDGGAGQQVSAIADVSARLGNERNDSPDHRSS